jgi:hypothetical protein
VTVNVPEAVADSGRLYTDKSTKLTYQDVPILAKAGTFYIVRVTEAMAEEISHLQASGTATFSLALRPPEDTRTVDVGPFGETTNRIIDEYDPPIPETYPRSGRPPRRASRPPCRRRSPGRGSSSRARLLRR